MPSDPELFYLEVEDYQDQTTVPTTIDAMTDDEVESLLLETMAVIDAYIGSGWAPFDDSQEFIFPRCQDEDDDGNAFIPRPVSLATRMIADAIVQQRQKGVSPHEVASETNLGHSYSKKDSVVSGDHGFEVVPPSACGLLEKYKRQGGMWAVDQSVCDVC